MKEESNLEFSYRVENTDLASELSSQPIDTFPRVLSTSRMIALMEIAAARLMTPLLKKGELSVGVDVKVKHIAATPCGKDVQARAIFKGVKGKLYVFEVELHDDGGLAGRGLHTRAIVDADRLVTGALERTNI